jgi:hypothetical protein
VRMAGRFGVSAALVNASCSGECPAGYYCPAGTANSTSLPCGGASVYCPPASGAPVAVAAGWYSTPDGVAPSTTRTGTAVCVPGEYCVAGVRRQCPGGYYSDSPAQQACADCPPGALLVMGRGCPFAFSHVAPSLHPPHSQHTEPSPVGPVGSSLVVVVLCCAVLCCAVLCCAVLCCAVLCCAVLCCAVLCCAVLCRLCLLERDRRVVREHPRLHQFYGVLPDWLRCAHANAHGLLREPHSQWFVFQCHAVRARSLLRGWHCTGVPRGPVWGYFWPVVRRLLCRLSRGLLLSRGLHFAHAV